MTNWALLIQYYIKSNNLNVEFSCGDTYESIVVYGVEKPSENELLELEESAWTEELLLRRDKLRHAAYIAESDPIFFKWQRGEASEQDWINKVNEIKARFV